MELLVLPPPGRELLILDRCVLVGSLRFGNGFYPATLSPAIFSRVLRGALMNAIKLVVNWQLFSNIDSITEVIHFMIEG